jgi:hypothetical protein
MIAVTNQQFRLFYSNGFEKAKAGRQKFLKHLQNVSTKNDTKHWLYTVLCCRFNATQLVYIGTKPTFIRNTLRG